jgi:hypothetical protein
MLVPLKRATRRYANLVWLMVFVFAIAPGISRALVTPIGAFTGFVVHAHAHSEPGHVHYGHHHHGHDHGGQAGGMHQHGGIAGKDGQAPDHGQHRTHVHYDVCCPSLVIPVLNSGTIESRVAEAFSTRAEQATQGARPDGLLRPPIVLSSL